jgi:peptide/nickel transport system permease protein
MMFQEQGYAEDLAAMRALLGLDRPLHVQYLHWLGKALRGDLGTSLWTKNPVLEEILYRFPVTLELGLLAMVFALSMAIPIGVLSAVRQDTLQDYVARSLAIGGLSIPNFWLATIAIVLPAYYFGWTLCHRSLGARVTIPAAGFYPGACLRGQRHAPDAGHDAGGLASGLRAHGLVERVT